MIVCPLAQVEESQVLAPRSLVANVHTPRYDQVSQLDLDSSITAAGIGEDVCRTLHILQKRAVRSLLCHIVKHHEELVPEGAACRRKGREQQNKDAGEPLHLVDF